MVGKGTVRGQSPWLKVPNLFCLYHEQNKFPEITYSSHAPCILEIQYKESEIQLGKKAYLYHSFDYVTKKITTDHKDKHKVEDNLIISEFVQQRKTEIQYLLLPFADIFVFDYPNIQGWFMEMGEKLDFKCKYGQLFYESSDIDLADKQELHTFCNEDMSSFI